MHDMPDNPFHAGEPRGPEPPRAADAELETEARALAQGWTAGDVHGLLPLYVGGDLEPVEQRALALWLAAHPAARPAADAAFAARAALRAAAVEAHGRATPDLWPGIRAALHQEGWLAPRSAAVAAPLQLPVALAALEVQPARPRRWLVSSGAAAAGLLFTVSLAWLLGLGSGGSSAGIAGATGEQAPALVVRTELGAAAGGALTGGASQVRLVAGPEAPGAVSALPAGVIRLGAPTGAPLEQHAVEVDLGHHLPGVFRPAGGAALAGDLDVPSGPRLTPHSPRR